MTVLLYVTGKHRQSEVTLRQSDRSMTSLSAAPTGIRLMGRLKVSGRCCSVSQYDGQTYVGVRSGVDRVTRDGHSSRVISVDGRICSVSVNDGVIYALVDESGGDWTVKVYDSECQPIRSWTHDAGHDYINQLAVRKDSVLIPHIVGKTIVQYSLTGEVERRIPCHILKNAATWLCVMSSLPDTVVVSCGGTVSCIDLSTGDCVWSTDSLERPIAVCCGDADRVYVAVGGKCATIHITLLDGDTGEAALTSQTHPYSSHCSVYISFIDANRHVIQFKFLYHVICSDHHVYTQVRLCNFTRVHCTKDDSAVV